jgi:hypothetical protein
MKGPGGRLRNLVRREWRCPVCDRQDFTGGDIVNRQCECLAHNEPPRLTWMMLVEEQRKSREKRPEPVPESLSETPS